MTDLNETLLREVMQEALESQGASEIEFTEEHCRYKIGGFSYSIRYDALLRSFGEDPNPEVAVRFIQKFTPGTDRYSTWDEAKTALVLGLERQDTILPDHPCKPIGNTVAQILGIVPDDGDSWRFVTDKMLADWGVDPAEAWAIADSNSNRRMAENGIESTELKGVKMWYFSTDSLEKAGYLAASGLKEFVKDKIGWPIVAIAPAQDFVLMIDAKDDVSVLGYPAVNEHESSPFCLTTEVFEISDEGIQIIGEFRPDSEEE